MKNTSILKSACFGFLLIAHSPSSSAQSIEVRGKDTVVVLPIAALKQANGKLVELQGCKEERDSLFSQTRTFTGLVNNQRGTIQDLKEAIRLDASLIADKQKIIDLSDKELKKTNRRLRLLKIERAGLLGVVAVLGAKILIFK